MLIEKDKVKERHEALMTAFSDEEFRNDLEKVKDEFKEWLEKWMVDMSPLDSRLKNVFSIEARVKGKSTFEEKLYRKNYIHDWPVSDDKEENQRFLRHTLTDLIGLRVNCHFVEYEKAIYDYFTKTASVYEKQGFVFNFKENKVQKNGNTIYKFSGIYKNEYHFEVQIKSIVHNVWGEVEHRTVYKNPIYDGFYEKKKSISETLHDVMLASDRELHILFNMKETEDQLLRSLFFCRTSESVSKKCRTNVLGGHYNSYFRAFEDIEPIKNYLICALSGKEYQKEHKNVVSNDFYNQLIEAINNTFPPFYLECLFNIDSELNTHQDYNSFLVYFLQHVVHAETDDFDKGFSDDFNSQEEEEVTDPLMDYLVVIDDILGTGVFMDEKENK